MASMTAKLRAFVQGMGSILDLCPPSPPRRVRRIASRSVADSLRSDWAKVGRDLQASFDRVANGEQEQEEG